MSAADNDRRVTELREIVSLLSTAVEKLISERKEGSSKDFVHTKTEDTGSTISHAEHDAVKTVLAAAGSLESLVVEPHVRLISLSTSYTISRALHIAAENNIAEVLAQAGDDGLRVVELARSTGIEEKKLCKYVSKTRSGEVCLAELIRRPRHA